MSVEIRLIVYVINSLCTSLSARLQIRIGTPQPLCNTVARIENVIFFVQ